jgi:glycosyltransferase involved in cell wall biosynthesis
MDGRIPEVTVVVPVFNGEEFIEGCIGQIRDQTFSDYEVLIVVDTRCGDSAKNEAERISSDFPNCKVIIQTDDMRLGGARNLGLRNASGRLIWFADVDDIFSPDLLEKMVSVQRSSEAEIVCCNFVRSGPKDRSLKDYSRHGCTVTVMDRKDALYARSCERFPVTTWSKVFVKQFLLDNGLFFNNSLCEDIYHTYHSIRHAEKVAYISEPLYGYRMHSAQLTGSKDSMDKRGQDELLAYDKMEDLFSDRSDIGEDMCRRFAVMRMRASCHMTYHEYMEYAGSTECRDTYDKWLRGTRSPEGKFHRYLPRLYFTAVRVSCRLIFYHKGRTFAKPSSAPVPGART